MTSDFLTIETPENVDLDAEIAGFGTRCVAAMIDYLILIAIIIVISYLYFDTLRGRQNNNTVVIASWVGLQFIIVTFYHLFFEFLWNGQTPGKRVIGVRVVQANGLPLTTSSAIIRNLLRLFDFLPALYAVGLISMFFTRYTQRLGDLAARTIVIRERKSLKLESLREDLKVTYHHISRLEPLPANIRVDKLSQEDRRDLVDYLQRRKDLQKREYIVGIIATRIARKMENEEIIPEFRSPYVAERFLEQVARAFELNGSASVE